MSKRPKFLDGVASHLHAFSKAKGVSPDQVHIRLSLADGTHLVVRGLRTEGPRGVHGWGMIHGIAGEPIDALLIREDHINTVEFQLAPMQSGPLGLEAEA
jgi:hypothetical protein